MINKAIIHKYRNPLNEKKFSPSRQIGITLQKLYLGSITIPMKK